MHMYNIYIYIFIKLLTLTELLQRREIFMLLINHVCFLIPIFEVTHLKLAFVLIYMYIYIYIYIYIYYICIVYI